MLKVQAQSVDVRRSINLTVGDNPQRVTANSMALDPSRGTIVLDGSAGLTGLTMRAPTVDEIGLEVEVINIAAQTAALDVTGMVRATSNAYSIPACADAVVNPSITFKAINTTPQNAQPTPKWSVKSATGGVTVA